MAEIIPRRQFILQCLASGLYVSAYSQAKGPQSAALPAQCKVYIDSLQGRAAELMKKHQVPGLAIAIVSNGNLVWSKGFGVTNLQTMTPVNQATVFEVGAISKVAVKYAVLKLYKEKRLNLDSPIANYLPAEAVRKNFMAERLTTRFILESRTPVVSPKAKANDPFKGFDLLPTVIEQTSKQPFDKYMKANVLDPLGMSDSSFTWIDKYEKQIATGYSSNEKGALKPRKTLREHYRQLPRDKKDAFDKNYSRLKIPEAVAGLYSTVTDIAKFMIGVGGTASQEPVESKPGGVKKFIERGHSSVETPGRVAPSDGDEASQSSLIWGNQKTNDGAFWVTGNLGVFKGLVVVRQRSGIVLLANSMYANRLFQELIPRDRYRLVC